MARVCERYREIAVCVASLPRQCDLNVAQGRALSLSSLLCSAEAGRLIHWSRISGEEPPWLWPSLTCKMSCENINSVRWKAQRHLRTTDGYPVDWCTRCTEHDVQLNLSGLTILYPYKNCVQKLSLIWDNGFASHAHPDTLGPKLHHHCLPLFRWNN